MCRGEMASSTVSQAHAHNPQDAVLAAEAGVDGILISNHGGELFSQYPFASSNGQYARPSARIVCANLHRLEITTR